MKILVAILAVTLSAVSAALAHEGHEHAAGGGLFGLPPEYIHVLMNPIPGYGLGMGVLALGAALLLRNRTAQAIGLCLVILAAASAWPVAHYGKNAYKEIRGLADDAGQDALDEHMERAEKLIYVFYATAFIGLVALVTRKKFPKAATPLAVTTLIMGVASLGAGGWIAKAGGQIRHSEFRAMSATSTNGATHEHGASEQSHEMQPAEGHQHEMSMSDHTPSTNTVPHQHDVYGQPHEKMQSADMSGHQHEMTNSEQTVSTDSAAHQHGASESTHEKMQSAEAGGHKHEMTMPGQGTEKTPMPDTVEGVWKGIHEHHGELAASVNARQFKEVQLHAAMIGDLAKRLGELTPGLESGVGKITHTLDELKSSAETGSDTVMKIRFKEFEAALAGFEPQMKKQ